MVFCSREIMVETGCHSCTIDITSRVAGVIRDCRAGDGLALVYTPHTTSAVIINEAEPGLMEDIVDVLRRVVPRDGWRHDRIDSNAWSHLSASLLGSGVVVPVIDGVMGLGTWQSILFVELDGPRRRRVRVYYLGIG